MTIGTAHVGRGASLCPAVRVKATWRGDGRRSRVARRSHLAELCGWHGLPRKAAHLLDLRYTGVERNTWKRCQDRRGVRLVATERVVVCDVLRSLRCRGRATTAVRTWTDVARGSLRSLVCGSCCGCSGVLLAIKLLGLQHLLVLHPCKLVLLLLLLLGRHVRIVARRRLPKRLCLKLAAKHRWVWRNSAELAEKPGSRAGEGKRQQA